MAQARTFGEEMLVVRRLLEYADDAVSRPDDVSVRLGVITGDLAVETMVKTALAKLGAPADRDSLFQRLVGELVAAAKNVGKDVVYVQTASPLRRLRNTVQHDGTAPNPREARRLHGIAKAVVMQLATDIFGVALANLGLVDLIANADLRSPLLQAKAAILESRYADAAGLAVAAFDLVMDRWTALNQEVFGLTEGPRDLFARIVGTLTAGAYIPDLRMFRAVTKDAGYLKDHWTGAFTPTNLAWAIGKGPDEQCAAATFAVDFVAGLILTLEPQLAAS